MITPVHTTTTHSGPSSGLLSAPYGEDSYSPRSAVAVSLVVGLSRPYHLVFSALAVIRRTRQRNVSSSTSLRQRIAINKTITVLATRSQPQPVVRVRNRSHSPWSRQFLFNRTSAGQWRKTIFVHCSYDFNTFLFYFCFRYNRERCRWKKKTVPWKN